MAFDSALTQLTLNAVPRNLLIIPLQEHRFLRACQILGMTPSSYTRGKACSPQVLGIHSYYIQISWNLHTVRNVAVTHVAPWNILIHSMIL
jgi:hypothetical protein